MPKFLDKAEETLKKVKKVDFKFYRMGIQEFKFLFKYDCIWTNWCLCYLNDEDLYKFLNEARKGLRKNNKDGKSGLLFVKENVDKYEMDIIEEQGQRIRTEK